MTYEKNSFFPSSKKYGKKSSFPLPSPSVSSHDLSRSDKVKSSSRDSLGALDEDNANEQLNPEDFTNTSTLISSTESSNQQQRRPKSSSSSIQDSPEPVNNTAYRLIKIGDFIPLAALLQSLREVYLTGSLASVSDGPKRSIIFKSPNDVPSSSDSDDGDDEKLLNLGMNKTSPSLVPGNSTPPPPPPEVLTRKSSEPSPR